ncbi:hypothetical protein QBC46DRAFT_261018, partial [Diplogelasinospora grovesii]
LANSTRSILYYLAYLAEEWNVSAGTKLPGTYTIAPGCTGTRANNRCNFDEFIKYIWAADPDIEPPQAPPTGFIKGTSITDTPWTMRKGIGTWLSKVSSARFDMPGGPPAGAKVTKFVDGTLLLPSGDGDFYKNLARMGEPIADAQAGLQTSTVADPNLGNKKKVLGWSKEVAQAISNNRWEDNEKYRIPYFLEQDEIKNNGIVLRKRTIVPTVANSKPFEIIDMDATIAANLAQDPDVQAHLQTVNERFKTAVDPKTGRMKGGLHMKAIDAADTAALRCGCVLSSAKKTSLRRRELNARFKPQGVQKRAVVRKRFKTPMKPTFWPRMENVMVAVGA